MRVSLLSSVVLAAVVAVASAGWAGVRLPAPDGRLAGGAAAGTTPGVASAVGALVAPLVRDRSAWQPSPVPAAPPAGGSGGGGSARPPAAPSPPVPLPGPPVPAGLGLPAPAGSAAGPGAPPAAGPPPPAGLAGLAGLAAGGAGGGEVRPDVTPDVLPMDALRTATWLEGQGTGPGGLPEARGAWREVRFFSRALGRETAYLAWLPPGYAEGAAGGRPYPTLYLLHGVGGADGFGVEEWLGYALTEDLDRMLALGLLQPMLVVLPDGEQGYWINQAGGGPRWADFVAQDLVAHVDATFFTDPRPARRAVGGLSMGGHGALQLALNHPDVFGVVGAHSPTLRPFETSPEFFGDPAWFARYDPLTLARTAGGAGRLVVWIDVGADDRWRPAAEALRDALAAQGAPPVFRVLEGEHEGWYWMAYLPEYLGFYSEALSGSLAGG